MTFDKIGEWQPASLCSVDGFDGSVEAVSGGGNSGNSDGAGESGGGGGYATSGADVAALGIVGAAGAIGGAGGALAGVFGLSLTGLSPQQAAIDLAHDMSLGLGQAVTANPSISMFETASQSTSLANSGFVDNTSVPAIAYSQGSQ